MRSILSASFSIGCAVLTIVEYVAYTRTSLSAALAERGLAMMITILVFNLATFAITVAAAVKTGRKHLLCYGNTSTSPTETELVAHVEA